ncbi:SRPBCC family protein [Polymorphobacter sp.]|uniref:SRPBCC family protein n=1 Tax=Polymorphobacter sp. TaxID=1909290 RepID=UPI003F6ED971
MSDIDGALAPPGTRIAPRQNIKLLERGLSLAAGTAIGALAARRKGVAGIALGLVGSMLVTRGVTGAAPARRLLGEQPDEAAVAKAVGWSSAAVVSRSVTINAPRSLVYSRFRDIGSWSDWAVNVDSADAAAESKLRFVTMDPSGAIAWQGEVAEDVTDEVLTITSLPESTVPVTARYEFRDAPAGRGTEIHAAVAYEPPGGSLGRYAAKLTQREPGIQLRRDLKRFKSLIETGEIAVNAPQGAEPKA